jgi:hypothetical protein
MTVFVIPGANPNPHDNNASLNAFVKKYRDSLIRFEWDLSHIEQQSTAFVLLLISVVVDSEVPVIDNEVFDDINAVLEEIRNFLKEEYIVFELCLENSIYYGDYIEKLKFDWTKAPLQRVVYNLTIENKNDNAVPPNIPIMDVNGIFSSLTISGQFKHYKNYFFSALRPNPMSESVKFDFIQHPTKVQFIDKDYVDSFDLSICPEGCKIDIDIANDGSLIHFYNLPASCTIGTLVLSRTINANVPGVIDLLNHKIDYLRIRTTQIRFDVIDPLMLHTKIHEWDIRKNRDCSLSHISI